MRQKHIAITATPSQIWTILLTNIIIIFLVLCTAVAYVCQ